jgi:hypothetical protein
MRRLAPSLAIALALAATGCSDSPCQELGERVCACSGQSGDACRVQVESQVDSFDPGESTCEAFLASCSAPGGVDLCEWLLTAEGKVACGLAEKPAS